MQMENILRIVILYSCLRLFVFGSCVKALAASAFQIAIILTTLSSFVFYLILKWRINYNWIAFFSMPASEIKYLNWLKMFY